MSRGRSCGKRRSDNIRGSMSCEGCVFTRDSSMCGRSIAKREKKLMQKAQCGVLGIVADYRRLVHCMLIAGQKGNVAKKNMVFVLRSNRSDRDGFIIIFNDMRGFCVLLVCSRCFVGSWMLCVYLFGYLMPIRIVRVDSFRSVSMDSIISMVFL